MGIGCEHKSSQDRLFLSSIDKYSPVERCNYCVTCGVIEVRGDDHGKGVGFFIDLLTQFQHYISKKPRSGIRPLTEVEQRLIVKWMENEPLFCDPYGSRLSVQIHAFYSKLCNYRGQFTPEMLTKMILT